MVMASGVAETGTMPPAAQYQREVESRILRHRPEETFILSLLNGGVVGAGLPPLRSEKTGSMVFEQYEWPATTEEATVTTTAPGLALTTINLNSATPFRPRDLLKVISNQGGATGEDLRVATIVSTTQITVEGRGMFGHAAVNIAIGAKLLKVGSAIGEGGIVSKGIVRQQPVGIAGCCQKHREEMGATSEQLSLQTFFGREWPLHVEDKVMALKRGIARMILFNGAADYATTSTISANDADYGNKIWYSAGLNGRISTHRWSIPGGTYEDFKDRFITYIKGNEGAGSTLRPIAIASLATIDHMSSWGLDKAEFRMDDEKYGFVVNRLKLPGAPGGVLPIFWDPMLDTGPWERGLIILSLGESNGVPHIRLRHLEEGPPRNRSWALSALNDEGEDITTVGLTQQIIRAFEAVEGAEINLEMRHAIFDELAAA